MSFKPVAPNLVEMLSTHEDSFFMYFTPYESAKGFDEFFGAWQQREAEERRRDIFAGREGIRKGKATSADDEAVRELMDRWCKRRMVVGSSTVKVEGEFYTFASNDDWVTSWLRAAMHHPIRLRLLADVLEHKAKPWEPVESFGYRMLSAFTVLITQKGFPTEAELRKLVFPDSRKVLSAAERKRFQDHKQKLGLILPTA